MKASMAASILLFLAVQARGDTFPDSLPPPPPDPESSTAVIMTEKFQNLDAWQLIGKACGP